VRTLLAVAVLVSCVSPPALAQRNAIDWSTVDIKTQKLDENVYVLQFWGPAGASGNVGGNVGAFIGADGIVIVDSGYVGTAPKLEAALKAISDKPVRYVLNTHWHGDHSGADEYFGKTATIIAHENARRKMVKGGTLFPASPAVALPSITFGDRITVHMNGGDVEGVHFDRGHTDTDTVYFFPGGKVVQTGDDFVNWPIPGFPAIEQDSDGSGGVDGQIAALDYILSRTPADVKIIPGHGNVASRDDMVKMLAVLKDTRAAVLAGISQGKTYEQMQQEKAFAKWDYLNESRHIQSDVYFARLYKVLAAARK
jgi:cyclase